MKKLLWFDCIAGGSVGIGVLLLHGWLSKIYQLPEALVLVMGLANLLYACYSFSLAIRSKRSMQQIKLLASANMTWGVICFVLAVVFLSSASVFGLGVLIFEGLFVGGLGLIEWRNRDLLLTA